MMYVLIIAEENSLNGGIDGVVYLNPSAPDRTRLWPLNLLR